MSNINQFEEMLRSDETLQAKLAEAEKAFAGDKADEKAFFDAVIAPLAAEVGLPFTFEDMSELFDSRALNDAELEAVAGGDDTCYTVGGEDACFTIGGACDMTYGHA